MKPIKEKAWYPYAVAACIAVALFVFLIRFQDIWGALKTFVGFFRVVISGCIIAFIVNPLSKLMARSLFKKVKKDRRRLALSNLVAFILVIVFIIFSLVIVIPQLVDSIQTFIGNLGLYMDTIMGWMDEFGITLESLGLGSEQAEGVATLEVTSLLGNIGQYAGTIMSTTMNVGKVIFNFAVAFMLSMYILAEKDKLKKGCGRLIKAIVGESNYGGVCTFLQKSNVVFNSYIVYNLIDSLIIGGLNAVFMLILGMDYMGLKHHGEDQKDQRMQRPDKKQYECSYRTTDQRTEGRNQVEDGHYERDQPHVVHPENQHEDRVETSDYKAVYEVIHYVGIEHHIAFVQECADSAVVGLPHYCLDESSASLLELVFLRKDIH